MNEQYVDFDDDSNMWCIFDTETGFCSGTYCSEDEADDALAMRLSS